jgi:hypothetical protein
MEDRSSQSQLGGGEDNAFQGVARTVLFFPEEAIETSHSHFEGTQEGSFKKHILALLSPLFGPEKDCVTLLHPVL